MDTMRSQTVDSNNTTEEQNNQDGLRERVNPNDGTDVLSSMNLPEKLPSILDIKKTIPAHCFESHTMTSLYYMMKDFVLVALLYLLVEWSWTVFPTPAQLVLTPLFWCLQGTLFTAIFVVGHDAGHGSFSNSSLVNDICGNLCHTFLLCPYFMWKLSHRNHHKNTGNMDKDEVFYPLRQGEVTRAQSYIPGFGLGIGWFLYLIAGYGPIKTRQIYHFNPFGEMFRNHVLSCMVSFLLLAVWAFCLGSYWRHFGLVSLLYHWAIPVMVFGSFIVIITFLHHTKEDVPWYCDNLWSYVRGQISSVDRHYGWCHDLIHNIGTHQVHHLFPKIPHYHLEEATVSFQRAFPHMICVSTDRILPAFYHMFYKYLEQVVIKDNTQVHVYK